MNNQPPKSKPPKKYKTTKLKIKELRSLCESLGLSTEGKKKDLLNRINNFTIPDVTNENIDLTNKNIDFTNELIDFTNENMEFLNNFDYIHNNIQEEKKEEEYIYKSIRDQQDYEFNESLKADILKEKINLLKEIQEKEIQEKEIQQKEIQEKEIQEKEIQLNINELRLARLKYFNP